MRALLRAAAAATLAATALLAAPGPTAVAQAPDVAVALTTLEPAAPVAGDTLVLGGTVRNASGVVLENVQALLRYSRDPLESRSDVRRATEDTDYRFGRRDERFFDVVADRLPPGAAATFRLEVPVDDIGLVEPGVYAVGVDVRGTAESGGRSTLATERTLLPWMSEVEAAEPVPVAVLWTLAAAPELLPGGALRSDTLADELAPGGALAGLLSAAGDAPVGWLVDPDLVATVETMTDGYEIESIDGGLEPGEGSRAAAAWLETYRSTVASHETGLLPYASPDVVALARQDAAWAAAVAEQAVDASSAAADAAALSATGGLGPRRPRTDLTAPAGGSADADGLRALAAGGITTVVLSGDAVAPATTSPTGRVAVAEGSVQAVLTDPGLDAVSADTPAAAGGEGGGREAGVADVVEARQRWLAETALSVLDADRTGDAPTALVTAAPRQWRPEPEVARAMVEAWTTTPWVTPTTLAAIAQPAADGGTDDRLLTPDPPETAEAAELPADFVRGVAEAQADVTRYLHLLAEPDEAATELEPALLRAASAGWRSDLVAGRDYLTRVTAGVEEPLTQVSVLVPRSVTLSSRTGVFPLTVANDLDQPVLVDLELDPANPDRLSIEAVESLRVEAGEKAAVDIRAEAAANGAVPVVVRLSTTTGEPLGAPQELRVVATDYGAIGWVVVGVGALVLVGAGVVRIARRHRHPAEGERETAQVAP